MVHDGQFEHWYLNPLYQSIVLSYLPTKRSLPLCFRVPRPRPRSTSQSLGSWQPKDKLNAAIPVVEQYRTLVCSSPASKFLVILKSLPSAILLCGHSHKFGYCTRKDCERILAWMIFVQISRMLLEEPDSTARVNTYLRNLW